MKANFTNHFLLFALSIFMFLSASDSFAQKTSTKTWKNTSFLLPSDVRVVANTSTELSARNRDINISVSASAGELESDDVLERINNTDAVLKDASAGELESDDVLEIRNLNNTGIKAYQVNRKDGTKIFFAVSSKVDAKGNKVCIRIISKSKEGEAQARKILESMK